MSRGGEEVIVAIEVDATKEWNGSVQPLSVVPSYDWTTHEFGEYVSCFKTERDLQWLVE